ncbi:hypothetical protein GCM10010304_03830 [Streptomyces roseoviolaceus]
MGEGPAVLGEGPADLPGAAPAVAPEACRSPQAVRVRVATRTSPTVATGPRRAAVEEDMQQTLSSRPADRIGVFSGLTEYAYS